MVKRGLAIDHDTINGLITTASCADAAGSIAATHLVEILWPHWIDIAMSSASLRRLTASEDLARDVAARLAARLGVAGSPELHGYLLWRPRNPGKTVEDWLRIVAVNVVRDVVRSVVGRPRGTSSRDTPSVKRFLNDLGSSERLDEQGIRPPITDAITAREILSRVEEILSAAQLAALRDWLEGYGFDEMARRTEHGDAEVCRRELRAAIAALRRRFLTDGATR